tara:strand:- start:149 stop:628 length:480 start_codon:yes stop_codon:yes gene_type:complete
MKSNEELFKLLYIELDKSLNELDCVMNFDKELRDVAIYLSGIIENSIGSVEEWGDLDWIDDCLLNKVRLSGDHLSFWGIVIWGKSNTTNQWVDPFHCRVLLDFRKKTCRNFHLKFKSKILKEISYEEFSVNRKYWDSFLNSSKDFQNLESDWKINVSYA